MVEATETRFYELILQPCDGTPRKPGYFIVVPWDDPSLFQLSEGEHAILRVQSDVEESKLSIQEIYRCHPFHSSVYDQTRKSRHYLVKKTSQTTSTRFTNALKDSLQSRVPMQIVGRIKPVESRNNHVSYRARI